MKHVLVLLLFIVVSPLQAEQCRAVFADAAGSYSSSSSIRFQPGSSLWNTDGVIDFAAITDSAGEDTSCATSPCQLSGRLSAGVTLPAFQDANSTQDVLVEQGDFATLSPGDYDEVRLQSDAQLEARGAGVYRIRQLQVGDNSQVRLAGGVYWIDELLIGSVVTFAPSDGEKVTLFVKRVQTSGQNQFNSLRAEPADMALFAYGDVNIGQSNVVYGYIYAEGTLSMGDSAVLYGAVNAANVVMNDDAQVHYRPDSIVNIQSQGVCSVSVAVPDPVGHWPVNVCALSGSNTSVPDIIAGNNGQAVDSPSSFDAGRLCQAAYFRGEGDIISIPHSADYALASGTVSFWVNTDSFSFSNRPSAGGMGVFSKDSYGLDNGGHLTVWITEVGGVRVLHQNASTSAQLETRSVLSEGQWHHIAYSFGAQGMKLFVDGVLQGANAGFTAGMENNAEPIVLAGNAWLTGDGTSPGSELVDLYQGRIDDLKIYSTALTSEQVNILVGESESACTRCGSNPTLLSHWKMDVCSLTGDDEEIVDSIRAFNGRSLGGAQAIFTGKYCQSVEFAGSDEYINIPHNKAMELKEGTVSLWIKSADLAHNSDSSAIFSKDFEKFKSGGQLTISIDTEGRVLFSHESNGNNKDGVDAITTPLIKPRQWHLITYSWGNGVLTYHVDGIYLGEIPSSLNFDKNKESIILGASAESAREKKSELINLTHFFKGEIDDVRLYENALTTADIQSLYTQSEYACTTCDTAGPKALYRFESTDWQGEEGEVLDSSGNEHHGSALGRATTALPANPISCRVADIPANDSVTQPDAVNTALDINDIGERGTISFWYKSNLDWQGGGDRQLFDASRVADSAQPDGADDKFFFMSLYDSGQLVFGMEDADDNDLLAYTDPLSFDAGEWVHVALSWDVIGEDVDLYINGNRVYMQGQTTLTSAVLGELGELYLGDNTSSYLVNGSVPNSANGQFDDFRLYRYEQSRDDIRSDIADVLDCNLVHHYEITHPSQALTCDEADITIRACADAACTQLVTDVTTVALSPGNWSPAQVVSFNGETALSLTQRNTGNYALAVTGQDAGSVAAAPTVCTQGCEIDFVDAGFTFFDAGTPDDRAQLPDVVAQDSLGRVGIRAVRDNAGVCEALLTGEQQIDMSYDCVQDGASYSSNLCRVPFAGIAVEGDGTGVSRGALTLTFDDAGRTTLDGRQYSDAGRLALTATATIDGATITSGATTLDSIPARLEVITSDTSVFPAGENFSVTLRAVGSQGATLPGYSPGNLQGYLQRVVPADETAADGQWRLGDSAMLTSSLSTAFTDIPVDDFVAGEYQYNESYVEEVGSFEADIRDSQYLGSNIIDANSITLGRFTPAYFTVTAAATPALEDTCGVFTYMGQETAFEAGREPVYEVIAYNGRGQVTRNYGNAQWRLNSSAAAYNTAASVADESNYAGALTLSSAASTMTVTGQDNYDGIAEISVTGLGVTYSKVATVNASPGMGSPFTAQFSLDVAAGFFTDSDGICFQRDYPGTCENMTIDGVSGANLRYGRLRLENTYGPETESLRVIALAEYFDNGVWQRNVDDNCTVLDIQQSSGDIDITNASSGEQESDITGLLDTTAASGRLQQGVSDADDLVLGPPLNAQGQGVRGVVTLTLSPDTGADWAQYLNIDWNLDGVIDENDKPEASVAFGLYRGNDRLLNWRERF